MIGRLMIHAKEAWRGAVDVAKLLCVLHVTNKYLVSPSLAMGPSMLPTMNITGDVVLCEKISPRLGKVGPGDIVLVRSPENPKKCLVKRVMGVEGDRVTYVADPKNDDNRYETAVVPKGHIWIQGDNIYASRDSRQFGAVPYGLLQAKVFYRVSLFLLH
ncbi:hypothetical protein Tsubulata_018038 [Turnera subulata]|uniref:Peptidase S26 domain-containing protein n=1 Tax=Turnera subulata TaxID=218843 RepID=A0A9Q0J315_9ROSI|nr:hypothetical protein Tsubulata_018038 [Turnera subulata]